LFVKNVVYNQQVSSVVDRNIFMKWLDFLVK